MSGCMLALLAVGGVFVLGLVGLVVASVWFLKTDKGQAVVGMISDSAAAQASPGALAVKALCGERVVVIPTSKLVAAATTFAPDGGVDVSAPAAVEITCQPPDGRAVACDLVGAAFTKAEKVDGLVRISVEGTTPCSAYYDATGARVSNGATADAPPIGHAAPAP